MNKSLFIMGAPNAGKSTYLAALWHSINQHEMSMKLKLKKMIGDSQYLCRIENKWLAYEPLERTVIGQEKRELTILLTDGTDELKLEFPDLSGETFQNIYENREMSSELYEKIYNANAILYFINVEDICTPEFIAEIPEELRCEKVELDDLQKRNPGEHDPTQIQIIDLLQMISKIKKEGVSLGIIFSAWDIVEDLTDGKTRTNPRTYLKNQMNMLWQYIESNSNRFRTKVWGISAFGSKVEEYEKLLDLENPAERIKIVDENNMLSHDITSIILEVTGNVYDEK